MLLSIFIFLFVIWSYVKQRHLLRKITIFQLGIDYQVVDESGNALTPEANGGYKVVWENCTKGDKNIYVKALSAKKGSVTVTTWDPSRTGDDAISFTNTYIVKTDSYSVRAFTENYKVTVQIN